MLLEIFAQNKNNMPLQNIEESLQYPAIVVANSTDGKERADKMSEQISILVIDDDPDFLELVECNLRLAGFDVFQATTGPEGLKTAGKKRPTVILLDTMMPDMNGIEVLKELKNNRKTKDIPVFMLTAKTTMGDIEHAFDAGANDYITKPVEMMKLGEIIKRKLTKFTS
jgi:DNA-binding response OmpR family regulator